jgi:bacillithiol biosynthesis deacetylase BshB1
MGTRGDENIREEESLRAKEVLGLVHRENLAIPDTRIEATHENRLKLIEVIRRLKPGLIMTHYNGQRHPDHNHAYQLVKEACFFSGLRKLPAPGEPHRPRKILYFLPFQYDLKPNFFVDISDQFNKKMEAVKCYHTQFVDIDEHLYLTPYLEGILEKIEYYNGFYGRAVRVKYAEGFISEEQILIDDITKMRVSTF